MFINYILLFYHYIFTLLFLYNILIVFNILYHCSLYVIRTFVHQTMYEMYEMSFYILYI